MYESIIKTLNDAGYFSLPIEIMAKGWERLVVASKKRGQGGLGGNSFWLSCINDQWVIATWGGNYYIAPHLKAVEDFAISVFNYNDQNTMVDFPSALLEENGVTRISIDDFNRFVDHS